MSSVYQPKTKELANVSVCTSEHYGNHRSSLKVVGRVKRGLSAFVLTLAKKTGNVGFVDNTSSLTKRAKNDLVKFFDNPKNAKKTYAYLVVPKTKVRSYASNKRKK